MQAPKCEAFKKHRQRKASDEFLKLVVQKTSKNAMPPMLAECSFRIRTSSTSLAKRECCGRHFRNQNGPKPACTKACSQRDQLSSTKRQLV